jgi:hypothetical protein
MDNPLKDLALEKQKDLNEAYETLSDPMKKQAYDQEIHGESIVDRQPEWRKPSETQQDREETKQEEQDNKEHEYYKNARSERAKKPITVGLLFKSFGYTIYYGLLWAIPGCICGSIFSHIFLKGDNMGKCVLVGVAIVFILSFIFCMAVAIGDRDWD